MGGHVCCLKEEVFLSLYFRWYQPAEKSNKRPQWRLYAEGEFGIRFAYTKQQQVSPWCYHRYWALTFVLSFHFWDIKLSEEKKTVRMLHVWIWLCTFWSVLKSQSDDLTLFNICLSHTLWHTHTCIDCCALMKCQKYPYRSSHCTVIWLERKRSNRNGVSPPTCCKWTNQMQISALTIKTVTQFEGVISIN